MISFLVLFLSFNALVFLLFRINLQEVMDGFQGPVFLRVFSFTLFQAFLSAALSVLVGLLAAPGFARLGRLRRPARWIFLLPNIMSSVLVVLCLLLTFEDFPYGLWGIVLGHVFINSGLCAVWLGDKWLELEDRWAPVGVVLGAREDFLFRRGLLPLMVPQIKNTFAVVFALCLTSFAIPLVLGGGPQASTLEVLIYERLHTHGDVSSAIVLSIIQCLLQFSVFFLILRPLLLKTEYSKRFQPLRGFSPWTLLTALVFLVSFVPLLQLARMALPRFSHLPFLMSDGIFLKALTNSMGAALVVGLLTFILLALLAGWGWKSQLSWTPTLSGVVVGLAGILIFRPKDVVWALVWGHMAVIFLAVFRLSSPRLEFLRNRFEKVLRQLGSSHFMGLKKVYLRLGAGTYLAGGVLATCWSMGEFSVARMTGGGQTTLPLYVQGLLAHYRLEEAALSALILLGLSVVAMAMMEVIADGLG